VKKDKEFIIFLCIGCGALIASYLAVLSPGKLSLSLNDLPLHYIYYNKNIRAAFRKSFNRPKIIAAGIDRYTLGKIPARFPFPRSIYATVIKNLNQEEVNTIGLDLVFTGKSSGEEDAAFSEALKNSSRSKVVLAFIFGASLEKEQYILPLPEFQQANCALGLIDNPKDIDQISRRLNFLISAKNAEEFRYSFSAQTAACYLNKTPAQIIESIPVHQKVTLWDGASNIDIKNFLINYAAIPGEDDLAVFVSFYDLYANIDGLKKKFGQDFLKDSLVLIYSEAEILHDNAVTPLGKFPGGFLHLNGIINILAKKFLIESPLFTFLFIIPALIIMLAALRYFGFIANLFINSLAILIIFWAAVALRFRGISLNLSQIIFFCIIFFVCANIYKYVSAILQLQKIKNKTALDPLRNLFTLRYFYYHFDLYKREFYLGKELYLFFIHFENLKEEIQNMPLNSIRVFWKRLLPLIKSEGGIWAVYSSEEIVGGIFYPAHKSAKLAQSFKNTLQAILKENNLKVNVKVACLKVKREYSTRELLFALSGELKKSSENVNLYDKREFHDIFKAAQGLKSEEYEFLKSIDADIEERNRELLEILENLNKEQQRNTELFFDVILSLVNALEARDPYSEGHSQRVAYYSLKTAEKLGWNKVEIEKLRKTGLLHDLGKIGIPDNILHKKDKLTDDDFDFIKKHEIIAVKILEPLKEVKEMLPWILHHHERWDGQGYPYGLAGNSIPAASQIISLADVYDALTTGRDYKKALPWEDALKEIENNKGTQFNPEYTDIFLKVIRELQAKNH